LVEKLKEEFKQQEEHNQRVMASLKHERDSWLPASKYKLALSLELFKVIFCSLELHLGQTLKLLKKKKSCALCWFLFNQSETKAKSHVTQQSRVFRRFSH